MWLWFSLLSLAVLRPWPLESHSFLTSLGHIHTIIKSQAFEFKASTPDFSIDVLLAYMLWKPRGDIFVCTMATLCSSLYRLSATVFSSEARLCYSQVAFRSNSPSFPGYTTIRDLIPAHLSSCVSLNRLGDKFHAIKCSWEPEPSCKIPKIIFSELKNLSTILPPPSQKKPSANQQTG